MTTSRVQPARALWALVEPCHAVTYFAPEARAALRDSGIRRFWDGYFAARAAPLGAVSAGVVTAAFFGFAPSMVQASVPAVWQQSTPAVLLEARSAAAGAALERLLRPIVDEKQIEEAAGLLARAARTGSPSGRPLFAANLDLPVEPTPARRLWRAATLDGNGALTRAGADRRVQIEDGTDHLAATQFLALGDDELARLVALLTPMAEALTEVVPYPNPMGAPRPAGARLN